MIKITVQNKRICVSYPMIAYKRKNKTFKIDKKKEAFDFANSLSDLFIGSFDTDLYNFCLETNHPILRSKNLCFL